MLTDPRSGWTVFSLEGAASYGLSYLDDIPFAWLEQAIHGLETMLPFCVKGFLEPRRLLCTVSYWNCHIVVERDGRKPLGPEDLDAVCSHTSMLDFCKALDRDIRADVDGWASFVDYRPDADLVEKKRRLLCLLERLEALIAEREAWFGPNQCFLQCFL